MPLPVLILGQGFSGTAVALRLAMKGIPFRIVHDAAQPGASEKAAGLVNPVTGRRMARTSDFALLFPEAVAFYREAYRLLHPESNSQSDTFLKPIPIWKALHSTEEINFMAAKSSSDGYEELISVFTPDQADLPPIFKNTAGWCKIENGFHLEPAHFLNDARDFFRKAGNLEEDSFHPSQLHFENAGWWWKGNAYSSVISCLGLQCPWARPELIALKGEVYEFSGFPAWQNLVMKTEKFAIPLPNGLVRMGSTYHAGQTDPEPTSAGFEEIIRDVRPEILARFHCTRSWAGMRPTTIDRIPIVRKEQDNLFLLNGLGTKGISLSPYYSLKILELINLS